MTLGAVGAIGTALWMVYHPKYFLEEEIITLWVLGN